MHYSNKIIDGKKFASQILQEVSKDIATLKQKGVTPGIAAVVVGDNPASKIYVQRKAQTAKALGMQSFILAFDSTIQTDQLLKEIHKLNDRSDVHGILIQLPLPHHLDSKLITNAVLPYKDVDGFTLENIGKLATKQYGLVPCTPLGCRFLIKQIYPSLSGMHAVVIGRSNVVGRPMVDLLLHEDCTVSIVHSKTEFPEKVASTADILIAAVGQPHLVNKKWVKEGAVVIDVGITRLSENGHTKLLGDVNLADVIEKVKAITPVPGGVGPMTIAFLMKNTLKAFSMQPPL